jgi:hypothetical protein
MVSGFGLGNMRVMGIMRIMGFMGIAHHIFPSLPFFP